MGHRRDGMSRWIVSVDESVDERQCVCTLGTREVHVHSAMSTERSGSPPSQPASSHSSTPPPACEHSASRVTPRSRGRMGLQAEPAQPPASPCAWMWRWVGAAPPSSLAWRAGPSARRGWRPQRTRRRGRHWGRLRHHWGPLQHPRKRRKTPCAYGHPRVASETTNRPQAHPSLSSLKFLPRRPEP